MILLLINLCISLHSAKAKMAFLAEKPGRKALLTKRKKNSQKCTKMYRDDPQAFWDHVLWTDESIKVKVNTALDSKNIILTVKRDGSVMVWGCFAASGPGWLAIVIILHYITCLLADAFIQSDLQCIILSRRHTPWSNVGLRVLLKGHTRDRTTDIAGPSQVA